MVNKSVLIAGRGGALRTPGVSVFPAGCVSGISYIYLSTASVVVC